jgi:hypothetical protein
MSQIYYKVVNANLTSAWITTDGLVTTYEIGKFVSSPLKGTPLAVFNNIFAARMFSGIILNSKIFECHIKYKSRRPWLPGKGCFYADYMLNMLKKTIKQKRSIKDFMVTNLPSGTITCGQVKLIREVKK